MTTLIIIATSFKSVKRFWQLYMEITAFVGFLSHFGNIYEHLYFTPRPSSTLFRMISNLWQNNVQLEFQPALHPFILRTLSFLPSSTVLWKSSPVLRSRMFVSRHSNSLPFIYICMNGPIGTPVRSRARSALSYPPRIQQLRFSSGSFSVRRFSHCIWTPQTILRLLKKSS